MPEKPTKSTSKSHHCIQVKDDLVCTNGIAYLEGLLKIIHLRILITIVTYLQPALKHGISYRKQSLQLAESLISRNIELTADGYVHKFSILISEFRLGTRNGGRLRQYLQELSTIPIIFGIENRPCNLIASYDFRQYSRTVEIRIHDTTIRRLLHTGKGYFTCSRQQSLSFTNKYTLRIYWLICSWKQKGGFVISIARFRTILSLGPAYDRYDNIITKIIAPAHKELKDCFPIWFEYRLHDNSSTRTGTSDIGADNACPDKKLVFKIKLRISEDRKMADMQSARDICFGLVSSVGANPDRIIAILSRLDYEDLRPFLARLSELISYIRTHRNIKDADNYLATSITTWQTDWIARYPSE